MWVLLGLAVVVLGLAAWRFIALRPTGTTVALRSLPADGDHGWRHGKLVYDGEDLTYYKLRSLSPGADVVFERRSLDFVKTRRAVDGETDFLAQDVIIVEASQAGTHYEFGVDRNGAMALIAWIESAPDRRQVRSGAHPARQRGTRRRGR